MLYKTYIIIGILILTKIINDYGNLTLEKYKRKNQLSMWYKSQCIWVTQAAPHSLTAES